MNDSKSGGDIFVRVRNGYGSCDSYNHLILKRERDITRGQSNYLDMSAADISVRVSNSTSVCVCVCLSIRSFEYNIWSIPTRATGHTILYHYVGIVKTNTPNNDHDQLLH